MKLSSDLISQFVKITNDNTRSKKESTVYGTIIVENDKTYVQIDGSELLTPVSTTADAQTGERVIVMIKNHNAIITGNISSPAVRMGTVTDMQTDLDDGKTRLDVLEEDTKSIKETLDNMVNLFYPIGAIYISVNEIDPAVLFGGAWEKISGKFLLASSDSYAIGSEGGEESHMLTIDELPEHDHMTISSAVGGTGEVAGYAWNLTGEDLGQQYTTATGGGQAHNNMPPYLSVNMWKRIE